MPSPKRWFACSRDLPEDPEIWELMNLYGDRVLMLWLIILSILDQRDNVWRLSGEWLAGLSRRVRQQPATVQRALDWMISKGWLVVREMAEDGSPAVLSAANYFKYHRSAEHKRTDAASNLGTSRKPEVPPSEPILSDPTRPDPKEKKKAKSFSSDSTEVRLSTLLSDLIVARDSGFSQPNLQAWAKHIDLLLRVDMRSPEMIESVIRSCQGDPFWKVTILSTQALRKHFDRLRQQQSTQSNGNGLVSRMTREAATAEKAMGRM